MRFFVPGRICLFGEFQLTSCLDRLRQEDGFSGYIVQGRRFDVGVPDAYRQAILDFRDV